jgi:ribonuclease R
LLHDAHALAQKVRHHRFRNGSLDLDFPENKIRLDEQGKVLRIDRMENDASHQLIEEFMLLANEAVAGRLMALNRPSVYRIHEAPKEKKLNDYREDVLSHRVPCGNLNHRPEVQKLLSRLGTLPIGPALKIGFLRSLMRARYAVEPLGHYGLAKTKYTHFTSPIRRYADLVVHRSLFDKAELQTGVAKQIADHISATEKNSADAERDSKDVKLYAFLKAQIASKKPQHYAGLVTDVRNFGFFVDVPELGMSGGVPLSAIPDDFFVFDPASSQLVGRHTRRVIRLGDNVVVQIYKVDSVKKQVDFQLVVQRGDARGSRKLERHERRGSDARERREIKSAPPPRRGRGGKQGQKRRG